MYKLRSFAAASRVPDRPAEMFRNLPNLASATVEIGGWNVIWFWTMSFRLMPVIMKLTVSSRAPAVLKARLPWPRIGEGTALR